jgi:hypothetical protein
MNDKKAQSCVKGSAKQSTVTVLSPKQDFICNAAEAGKLCPEANDILHWYGKGKE